MSILLVFLPLLLLQLTNNRLIIFWLYIYTSAFRISTHHNLLSTDCNSISFHLRLFVLIKNWRFEDPHTLPCCHTFCRVCISDWIQSKGHCPLCRQRATITDLKKSFVLNDIVTNAQKGGDSFCGDCKRHADLSICDHCNSSICSTCFEKHLKKVRL